MLEGATPHPAALPPMPAVARILAQYDRDKLASFIEVAIGLLDTLDGDPDVEMTGLEDDFMEHAADGPGCPIADSDHCAAGDDKGGSIDHTGFDGAAGDPDDLEDDDPGGDALDHGEAGDCYGEHC